MAYILSIFILLLVVLSTGATAQTVLGPGIYTVKGCISPSPTPTASPTPTPVATPTPTLPYVVPPLINAMSVSPTGGDDKLVLQSAVNLGDLDILAGNYTVKSSISVPNNRNIRCEPGVIITNLNAGSPGSGIFEFKSTNSNSVIGCVLQGTNNTHPAKYNWNVSGYDTLIWAQNTQNLEIAGNIFQNCWGQACLEWYAPIASQGQGTGNMDVYNTYQNNGLYGSVISGESNVLIAHNKYIDSNGCMESDSTSQTFVNNLCDSNTFQHISGTGCENSSGNGCPMHMYLTCGNNLGLNYSQNTCSNNTATGGVDLGVSTSSPGVSANYSNNTGFNVR